MRDCRWCGTTDTAKFYTSQKSRYCRECWNKKYVLKGRDRAIDAKMRIGGCMDCRMLVTENNHYLFDFDHRPGEVKNYNVAQMRTASDYKFRQEIAKCDLVCLFCHRERTMFRLRNAPQDMSDDGNAERVAETLVSVSLGDVSSVVVGQTL